MATWLGFGMANPSPTTEQGNRARSKRIVFLPGWNAGALLAIQHVIDCTIHGSGTEQKAMATSSRPNMPLPMAQACFTQCFRSSGFEQGHHSRWSGIVHRSDQMNVVGSNVKRGEQPPALFARGSDRPADDISLLEGELHGPRTHQRSGRRLKPMVRAIGRFAVAVSAFIDPPALVTRKPRSVSAPREEHGW